MKCDTWRSIITRWLGLSLATVTLGGVSSVPLYSQEVEGEAFAADAREAFRRCDTLAAHPDDPEAVAPGVPDDRLNSDLVFTACSDAISYDQKTPRFRFQWARALLRQGGERDAAINLMIAARQGHGGALAMLGDLMLLGGAGFEADPLAAKRLYERAAEAGFGPARKALTAFVDQTQEYTRTEQEDSQAVTLANAPKRTGASGGFRIPKDLNHRAAALGLREGRLNNLDGEKNAKEAMASVGVNTNHPFFQAFGEQMFGMADSGMKYMTKYYTDGFLRGYMNMCSDMNLRIPEDIIRLRDEWKSKYLRGGGYNVIGALAVGNDGADESAILDGELDGGEIALADNCARDSFDNAVTAYANWLRR